MGDDLVSNLRDTRSFSGGKIEVDKSPRTMEERVNQNIQNIMGDNGYILDTINESYDQASSIPS